MSCASVGRRIVRGLSALALALGAGCTHQVWALMAGAPPDTPEARIDPNTPASIWSGVVSLDVQGNLYSGVLIGRRHVLTAAHALALNGSPPAANVRVNFNLGASPTVATVADYRLHPGYGGTGVQDLALLQLSTDAPAAARRYPLTRMAPAAGTPLTLVGYGESGNGSSGVSVGRSSTIKRVGRNVLDLSPDGLVFYYDFDGPVGSANFLGGATLGNGTETTVAGGDSGSPAFVQEGGQWVLAGINALRGGFAGGPTAAGVFGTGGGGMLAAPFRGWVEEVLAASGVEGNDADVPLPAWALLLLGAAFAASLRRSISADRPRSSVPR